MIWIFYVQIAFANEINFSNPFAFSSSWTPSNENGTTIISNTQIVIHAHYCILSYNLIKGNHGMLCGSTSNNKYWGVAIALKLKKKL